MRSLIWLAVLLAGFGLMLLVYLQAIRLTETNPWMNGLMFVGQEPPEDQVTEVQVIRMDLIYMEPSAWEKAYDEAFGPTGSGNYRLPARDKLVLAPGLHEWFSPALLAKGRLPEPGTNEILAGWGTQTHEWLQWGQHKLVVVGVLDRSVMMFAHAYLLAEGSPAASFFHPPYEGAKQAYVIPATRDVLRKPAVRAQLERAFPADRFQCLVADDRRIPVPGGTSGLYTLGMMLFVLGGVGSFRRLYGWLARTVRVRLLVGPLDAIVAWARLWWGLHLGFFAVYFLGSFFCFVEPELQDLALQQVSDMRRDSALAMATGAAYQARSVLLAAGLTLANNFLKSFGFLTVSSFVLPGVGVLAHLLLVLVAGMGLTPATTGWALFMLPHSVVLLVEMEAYILASFFALLIPVYLFRKAEGPSVLRRYGRAVLLNLKANVLVLIVLAVAALYEAIELILQVR